MNDVTTLFFGESGKKALNRLNHRIYFWFLLKRNRFSITNYQFMLRQSSLSTFSLMKKALNRLNHRIYFRFFSGKNQLAIWIYSAPKLLIKLNKKSSGKVQQRKKLKADLTGNSTGKELHVFHYRTAAWISIFTWCAIVQRCCDFGGLCAMYSIHQMNNTKKEK